jgi:formiminoglutamate deiminase
VSSFWCEYAWLGPRHGTADAVALEVDDSGTLTAVRPGRTPDPAAVRLGGLVIPGLVSAHGHAFHRALRGRTHAGQGDFWAWREAMYALAARLDPGDLHDLAAAAYGELALAGVTTVGEFHYLHHPPGGGRYADPNEAGMAVVAAAQEAGVRLTLLDVCYLSSGFGQAPAGVQRRFADTDAPAWAERAAELADRLAPAADRVRVGAAVHSVRAVTPEDAALVASWAAERSAPLHAHLSEQPGENEACLARYGRTPSAVLGEAGVWSRRSTAVHATHLTDADVGLLGDAGSAVCFCPTTERDLADGIGPARALVDAGARLCLGADSHAVADLLEEARAVELDARLATLRRGTHQPGDLLAAATAGGAAALGWPAAGRIAAGYLADLTAVSLDSVRLAGAPHGDLLAAVVFAAGAPDVTDVVVAGRPVVRDRAHLLLGDVAGRLHSVVDRVWERS